MKKIVFIAPKFPLGGAEKQLKYWIKEAKILGFYTIVISTDAQSERIEFADEQYTLNSPIVLPNLSKGKKLYYRCMSYLKIYKHFKKMDYHYCVFFNQLYLPLALKLNNLIFSVRELEKKYYKGFRKQLQHRCSIVTTNNIAAMIAGEQAGIKTKLIFNSIENKNFNDVEINNNKKILIVSNISRHKNIQPIINVVKNLESQGYTLKIAGEIIDKEYYNELSSIIGSSRNIEFLGFVGNEQLELLYKEASIFIHNSKKEGTANSIIDAIKYGKMIFVSDIPENMIMIDYLEDFVIYNERDLENKLKKLEKLNSSERQGLIEKLVFLQRKVELNYDGSSLKRFMKEIL